MWLECTQLINLEYMLQHVAVLSDNCNLILASFCAQQVFKEILRGLSRPRGPGRHTVGPNSKNLAKMRFKKLVKLTGYTYGCNILTHFEYKALAMTGNGNQVNLLKLDLKNS